MSKKMNVESFNLDHTKVKAPYIRLCSTITGKNGDVIYKYDLRFKQPNTDYMDMNSMHSLEHLLAENIRNYLDDIIDLSPMGCQTGFYLMVLNNASYEAVKTALEKTLGDIINSTKIPAENEIQCGGAARHDLNGAKKIAQEMLSKKDEWEVVF